MEVIRAIVTVLLVSAAAGAPVAAQKGPAPADVLRVATEYLEEYAPRVSGVTLEEAYTMLDVSGGRVSGTRRLTSDVVLLNLAGKVIALRDSFAIDNNPLRERVPRITSLLVKPTASARLAGASSTRMRWMSSNCFRASTSVWVNSPSPDQPETSTCMAHRTTRVAWRR